jgi:hypothetical protein
MEENIHREDAKDVKDVKTKGVFINSSFPRDLRALAVQGFKSGLSGMGTTPVYAFLIFSVLSVVKGFLFSCSRTSS